MEANTSVTVSAPCNELAALVDAIPAPTRPSVEEAPLRDVVPQGWGRADRLARKALFIRAQPDSQPGVHNIFSSSIALSGSRCLLTYVVLPLLATVPVLGPLFGARSTAGSAIGVAVGVLALVFDVRAIRRFFLADHQWRWVAALLYLAIMAMVTSLLVGDISRLA